MPNPIINKMRHIIPTITSSFIENIIPVAKHEVPRRATAIRLTLANICDIN
jgi:hypothetical protein